MEKSWGKRCYAGRVWMTDYILEIKRQFRDVYQFVPEKTDPGDEPIFAVGQIPDGVYPMTIAGKTDRVRIEKGKIYCRNFVAEAGS